MLLYMTPCIRTICIIGGFVIMSRSACPILRSCSNLIPMALLQRSGSRREDRHNSAHGPCRWQDPDSLGRIFDKRLAYEELRGISAARSWNDGDGYIRQSQGSRAHWYQCQLGRVIFGLPISTHCWPSKRIVCGKYHSPRHRYRMLEKRQMSPSYGPARSTLRNQARCQKTDCARSQLRQPMYNVRAG
jgi:hypothetical protein